MESNQVYLTRHQECHKVSTWSFIVSYLHQLNGLKRTERWIVFIYGRLEGLQGDLIRWRYRLHKIIGWIYDWMQYSLLKFHPQECNVLRLSKKKKKSIDSTCYNIGDRRISAVRTIVDLGITFNELPSPIFWKTYQRKGKLAKFSGTCIWQRNLSITIYINCKTTNRIWSYCLESTPETSNKHYWKHAT